MIHLILVDEYSIVCQGLQSILNLEKDIQVLGVATTGEQAIELVIDLEPNLVLIDIQMFLLNGENATQAICRQFPELPVLVLSTSDEEHCINKAIRAGAKGYLLKDIPVEELVQAIRQVHLGYTQLAPGLLEKLMAATNDVSDQGSLSDLSQLTPRETEVLNLVALGHTNREIGEQLYISEGTVKTHVTHILNRLDLRNRAQLAIFAYNSLQLQTSL
ncbi:response regulator transcription factor [Acaryochloris sp. CCMEE 5410]|uniref:response regulator n=1 Tax=Acaryochloris sp. CCMEE 5410 TaxID=310037 RepID=UPI00024849FD|nr:response regulator transcription factor [Acaryochloris sp. CCMEE 5410]KAI9133341.1 response regulator transcription factor [Acaryochloris sp. CCMEE 5410]